MKIIILSVILITGLYASIFGANTQEAKNDTNKEIHDVFRQNVSDANAIIKRGDYAKITRYKEESLTIMAQIEHLDIPDEHKLELKKDLSKYSQLINKISSKLQTQAPKLNQHYTDVVGNIATFNKKLSSIGLSELLSSWYNLSKAKNRYVKKPSKKLEKEFDKQWTSVITTISELYLDEEMEEPLFEFLHNYKAYFKEITIAYNSVTYSDIRELKPLSYKIKAQLELLVPYEI
ncbi:hypothetical protein KJ877_01670 [bacterium]|nr:hypothetical protein [bacterium]MBU1989972.1 hypothetical protein [bacterium]